MSGLSDAELAKVLAAIQGQTPPVDAPTVVPLRVPFDASVEVAKGAVLAEALGNPDASNRPGSVAADDAPCVCWDGNPDNYEGPQPTCPRHGTVRGFPPPRPSPYRCRACGGEMDAFHAAIGTHPTCDPDPGPIKEPPSTIATLHGILTDYQNNSDRSQQVEIGPSEIGVPCDRRLAYRLHGKAENQDGCLKWAALQGTAMHELIAKALQADNERLGRQRWRIEHEVWPDPTVKGHSDALDTDNDAMTVIDWKLTGKSRLDTYRRKGPGDQYEKQAHLYGLGYQRAGFPVRFIRIVFLPRTHDFNDAYEWTAPYSRTVAEAALDRMYGLMEKLHDVNASADPHVWEQIPATPSDDCRYCPYFRRGGPADGTGCPGDVEAQARRDAKFNEGLIP